MAWRQTRQEDPAENRREQWQGKLGPKGSGFFFALCGKGVADGTLYSCKLEGEPTGKLESKRK